MQTCVHAAAVCLVLGGQQEQKGSCAARGLPAPSPESAVTCLCDILRACFPLS